MPVPSASNYPASLDADSSLGGDAVNLTAVTLSGAINNATTTITTTATLTNVNVPCWLLIDSELVYAEAKSGADFTSCNRGAGGSSAAAHSDGASAKVVYAANHFNQLKRAVVAIETEIGAAPKTIDDTVSPGASPTSVAAYLDMVANMIKQITGKAAWYTAPSTSLEAVYPPGHLYGLTLSNNGTDPTNDIDIATGNALDATNAVGMVLGSALTKRLDAAWTVGTNQGGLDTGAIADTTYHVWLIKRSDTGVVDALFSASASSPTMPANYDYKRRIGSIRRISGAIKTFVQDGDTFMWKTPVNDVSATNPGTSAVTRTLTVPTGIRVEAIIGVSSTATAVADAPGGVYISDLSVNDVVAGANAAFSVEVFIASAVTSLTLGAISRVFTDTSAQVRSRLQISDAGTVLYINTHGWVDRRNQI